MRTGLLILLPLAGWGLLALILAVELADLIFQLPHHGSSTLRVNILTGERAWLLVPVLALLALIPFLPHRPLRRHLAAQARVLAVFAAACAVTILVVIAVARAGLAVEQVVVPLYMVGLLATAGRLVLELRRLAAASRFPGANPLQ